jgi:hypothetical protein
MSVPKSQECLCLASLSSLVLCNILAYWAHFWVTKKMKCCEHCPPRGGCSTRVDSSLAHKPYTGLERPVRVKHFCLFVWFLSDEGKKVSWIRSMEARRQFVFQTVISMTIGKFYKLFSLASDGSTVVARTPYHRKTNGSSLARWPQ